jgi:hypothetical protein
VTLPSDSVEMSANKLELAKWNQEADRDNAINLKAIRTLLNKSLNGLSTLLRKNIKAVVDTGSCVDWFILYRSKDATGFQMIEGVRLEITLPETTGTDSQHCKNISTQLLHHLPPSSVKYVSIVWHFGERQENVEHE